MFPSSGLFIHISCPFSLRGLCERPHCLYKHAAESRETFGGLYKSPVVDLTGDQCDSNFTTVIDNSLHELERLDKQIESVRYEVEQEQRRLSSYQTNQADKSSNKLSTKFETNLSYGFSSSKNHKSHVQAQKYVVDNSKPRTDLEYDPMSNFSAALHSCSSSGKEAKSRPDRKSSRSFGEKPSTHQAQMYRPRSPEILDDDSTEDGVLVIDVSLSPDKTLDQTQHTADSGKSSQNTERDMKEIKAVNVYLDFQPQMVKTKVVNASSCDDADKVPEIHPLSSTLDKTQDYSNDERNVVDLTGCLEELERECENTGFQSPERKNKWIEPGGFSFPSDQPSNPLMEQTYKAQKKDLKSQNSFVCKRSYPNTQFKQTSITDQDKLKVQSQLCVLQNGEKTKMKAFTNQKQVEAAQGSSQIQIHDVRSVNPHSRSESMEQLLQEEDEAVIIIDSSPEDEDHEDEVNYSELSESDPMEECYRIFMEANTEEKGSEEQGSASIEAEVETPEVNAANQNLTGRKRLAHEAKNLEQPLAKMRPQPQVLVPLREPGGSVSRLSICAKVQEVQYRASAAPAKLGQNLLSSVSQKKPETQTVPSTPTLKNLQVYPGQNAYLSCVPLGTAVIEVGSDLHLILPQGHFPLSATSSSSPVSSVLTPMSRVHPNPTAVRQTTSPAAVSALPKYRSTAPLLIAAPARRPAASTAFGSSVQSTVGISTASQAVTQTAVKPLPVKRKLKQQSEAAKDKVPHDVRQRYVNMFTEEFLKTTADVNEAFEKALTEEKSVYNRSVNKLKYLSIAVNALKRLKNQSATAKKEKQTQSQRPKGNIPFNQRKIKENGDLVLYEILKGYTLTDEQMIENNYPVQHPEKPGSAVLFSDKKVSTDSLKRICCRCGATYSVGKTGKHLRTEECNYHYGKGVTNRVPGGVETRYSCCQGVMGAPGCQMFKLHVHDYLSLDGFVSTAPRRPSDSSCPGVYSLDCEMCYTVQGLELSRVTVISSSLQVVYDTFVKPDNEVIDYNTRFSGISEEDVKGNHTSLKEVQDTLLSFISADTILVGHGLETDLCLLKLLHGTVVDTSVVFPHRLGPPNKLSLNSLTAEYLRRIIQESVCGHDTGEDAAACMELMLWKMKEDGKLKK
ncbi:PREDICTED: RNA exonuclease 1 homolog isoform X2 [Poecilia mexicana]|uniref:Exonuclease domain-containing protein n=1 Tax=Poecilia mexicana TaxID=48701 RepID=A0A3B3YVB5_9TELE|nr:PREDICTED: RNA exonuclease 1 homolog isoform X2 [Poecilia mexicana]